MTDIIVDEFVELKREAIRQVKFYVELAEKKIQVRIPMPRVIFSIRGGVAGRATYSKNLIEFNPTLLKENADTFLIQTTGHEVAHLVARARNPNIDPHGNEWRKVMWAFSLPANRCHNYDVNPTRHNKKRARQIKVEGGVIIKETANGRYIDLD